jgi:hypothetical protein
VEEIVSTLVPGGGWFLSEYVAQTWEEFDPERVVSEPVVAWQQRGSEGMEPARHWQSLLGIERGPIRWEILWHPDASRLCSHADAVAAVRKLFEKDQTYLCQGTVTDVLVESGDLKVQFARADWAEFDQVDGTDWTAGFYFTPTDWEVGDLQSLRTLGIYYEHKLFDIPEDLRGQEFWIALYEGDWVKEIFRKDPRPARASA